MQVRAPLSVQNTRKIKAILVAYGDCFYVFSRCSPTQGWSVASKPNLCRILGRGFKFPQEPCVALSATQWFGGERTHIRSEWRAEENFQPCLSRHFKKNRLCLPCIGEHINTPPELLFFWESWRHKMCLQVVQEKDMSTLVKMSGMNDENFHVLSFISDKIIIFAPNKTLLLWLKIW